MAVKTGLGDWGGRIRTCASEIGGAERRVAQCEIGLSVQLSSCSRSSKDEVKSALERRRVRRIWFSDAEVRIPPSRLRVLANSDSGTQRFESCRPSQPVQCLSRSRRQQYQEILSPRIQLFRRVGGTGVTCVPYGPADCSQRPAHLGVA